MRIGLCLVLVITLAVCYVGAAPKGGGRSSGGGGRSSGRSGSRSHGSHGSHGGSHRISNGHTVVNHRNSVGHFGRGGFGGFGSSSSGGRTYYETFNKPGGGFWSSLLSGSWLFGSRSHGKPSGSTGHTGHTDINNNGIAPGSIMPDSGTGISGHRPGSSAGSNSGSGSHSSGIAYIHHHNHQTHQTTTKFPLIMDSDFNMPQPQNIDFPSGI